MDAEAFVQTAILEAWGAHPRLRLWRANVGVGWYEKGKPACKCHHPNAYPVRYGVKGQWDLSGMLDDGRRIEIEVKGPGGKLTEEQETWGRIMRRFKVIAIEAWSVEDVDRGFAAVGVFR